MDPKEKSAGGDEILSRYLGSCGYKPIKIKLISHVEESAICKVEIVRGEVKSDESLVGKGKENTETHESHDAL